MNWEGEIPKKGKFPRVQCLLPDGLGIKMCSSSLSSQGQVAWPSLLA